MTSLERETKLMDNCPICGCWAVISLCHNKGNYDRFRGHCPNTECIMSRGVANTHAPLVRKAWNALAKQNHNMSFCPFCGHKGIIIHFWCEYKLARGYEWHDTRRAVSRCPNIKCNIEMSVSAANPHWVRRKWNKRA